MGKARGVEGFGGCRFLSSSCLINSGCLGLSGLSLTDWACGGGPTGTPLHGGGGGALVGLYGEGPKGLEGFV